MFCSKFWRNRPGFIKTLCHKNGIFSGPHYKIGCIQHVRGDSNRHHGCDHHAVPSKTVPLIIIMLVVSVRKANRRGELRNFNYIQLDLLMTFKSGHLEFLFTY